MNSSPSPLAGEGGRRPGEGSPAANDAEARYWAALNATARQRAKELKIEGWGTSTDGPAPGSKANAKICDVYYFHTDQVGLPEELSNSQGQLVWRASYKTWGSTVTEDWSIVDLDGGQVHELDKGDRPTEEARQQNLRFQGQYLDRDTGLHYNTFRYYDPDIGRFISPDPIGLEGGLNLGSYSPNPISWIDPWGWSCGGAKRGPKTDPNAPHNKTIRETADKLEAEGNVIVAGGGRRPEVLIDTPGGHKGGRRPDIIYETPSGQRGGVNVGKTKADGTPVTRETKALDDLNNRGGLPTIFIPY